MITTEYAHHDLETTSTTDPHPSCSEHKGKNNRFDGWQPQAPHVSRWVEWKVHSDARICDLHIPAYINETMKQRSVRCIKRVKNTQQDRVVTCLQSIFLKEGILKELNLIWRLLLTLRPALRTSGEPSGSESLLSTWGFPWAAHKATNIVTHKAKRMTTESTAKRLSLPATAWTVAPIHLAIAWTERPQNVKTSI